MTGFRVKLTNEIETLHRQIVFTTILVLDEVIANQGNIGERHINRDARGGLRFENFPILVASKSKLGNLICKHPSPR
jgi:hypothetical protein